MPPGDDAAVLADGTAITTDALVEGVHFDHRLDAADVGWKVLAVSVSDLAATGARPAWAVLDLCLPGHDPDWIEAFARGFGEAAHHWGVTLIGGDTTASPGPRFAAVTLGGPCVAAPLQRGGGRPGDDLWVTGIPGLAGAGWSLPHPPAAALAALRRPEPPLAFALALVTDGLATAGMDLSDGLASDLPRLARASGCGARVDPQAMPPHPALDALPAAEARRCRLAGGDDYELLFTAPPARRDAIVALAGRHGTRVSRIGALLDAPDARPTDGDWPAGSFSHFPEAA